MSLLIKALEQAAKDRKAARADAEKASSEAEQSRQTSTEPTLEPPPPPRASARPTPDPAPASPGTQLSLDPSSPASTPRPPAPAAAAPPPPRPAPASAAPAAAARRSPTSLASLANIDAQQERARAAAVMQASGNTAGNAIAWLRANPVMLVAGIAVLFGVAFGLYVYLQVSHPGMFIRQAATKPQDAAPPAPPAPSASPPQPPGLPETAGAGTVPPADSVLAPPGTQPVGPAAASGTIASAAPQTPASPQPTAAPSTAPPSAPLASSSVIGAAPTAEFPRTTPSERVTEARRERGSIRPPTSPAAEPGEPAAPAPPSRRASVAAAGPEPGREGIRVSQTAVQPRLNPQLSQAYTLLQSGNVEEARGLYNRVVQAEPLNVDALLGLAYIAAQENRADDASKYYLRILQLNPRHAVAQAALIGLMGRADPAASESRLKQLIAREPSPFLHFVLGNLYADQTQWSQAQQSYFQAHHLEPDNPDYAYNLAVGLDHLRQGKLALNFYRRADQLASMQGRSNFNLSHARERIRILASQVE